VGISDVSVWRVFPNDPQTGALRSWQRNHTATVGLPADDDRMASQSRVLTLHDTGVKRIHINMNDFAGEIRHDKSSMAGSERGNMALFVKACADAAVDRAILGAR